jgi:quercetin 2,3-dioxygenase
VQWMTAGGGVLHKEYHEKSFDKKGGAFEMVQLWINLPRKHKMTAPKYQSILHAHKPKVDLPNNMGSIHVVAGDYKGTQGIASAFSPIHIYDFHLNPNGEVNFSLPSGFNSAILVIDGGIKVNEIQDVAENHYVQFKNEPGEIHIKASKKSILLVLSGEPLNEPYVSYGPFVMNTETEIKEAIEDYNAGKFGFLAD